jgi:hypothetical protein
MPNLCGFSGLAESLPSGSTGRSVLASGNFTATESPMLVTPNVWIRRPGYTRSVDEDTCAGSHRRAGNTARPYACMNASWLRPTLCT